MVRLDDANGKYLEKYYSTHVNILNSGGLTLMNGEFFVFGMRLMKFVRESFTMKIMDNNPKHGFGIAKKAVLENESLSNYVKALCKRYSRLEGTNFEVAMSAVSIFRYYTMLRPTTIWLASGGNPSGPGA